MEVVIIRTRGKVECCVNSSYYYLSIPTVIPFLTLTFYLPFPLPPTPYYLYPTIYIAIGLGG